MNYRRHILFFIETFFYQSSCLAVCVLNEAMGNLILEGDVAFDCCVFNAISQNCDQNNNKKINSITVHF